MSKTALAPPDPGTGWSCEYCDREFSTEKGAALHEEQWCPQNPAASRTMGRPKGSTDTAAVDASTSESPPVELGVFDVDEPAPEPAKKGWRNKLWGADEAKPAAPKTSEYRPRKRRKSTESVWQILCIGAGRWLIYTSADIPVGNALTFQAPVVGPIIDKAIAGTFIDTALQPLVGAGEKLEDVSDVLALPAIVGIMERAPQLAPALEPLLRKAIRRHLVEYARMAKAQKKADAEYAKALDDLGMDVEGDDPVDGIIAQIWAGAPSPEEAPANNGAGHVDAHA